MSITELFLIHQENASLINVLQTLQHMMMMNSRDARISFHQIPPMWTVGSPLPLVPISEYVDACSGHFWNEEVCGREGKPRENLTSHRHCPGPKQVLTFYSGFIRNGCWISMKVLSAFMQTILITFPETY